MLRAPNIMKHTLRCHGFGDAGHAARSSLGMGMHLVGRRRPKPCQPTRGCGQNRRRAGTWSRDPLAGCDRAGACEDRASGALLSRSGVASKQKTLGTCSALRGTLCRESCQYSEYWLHLASRYRRFWLATHARFIMLGALRTWPAGRRGNTGSAETCAPGRARSRPASAQPSRARARCARSSAGLRASPCGNR